MRIYPDIFKNPDIVKLLFILSLVAAGAWYFFDIVSYVIVSVVIAAILRTPTNYISQAQFYGVRVPRVVAILFSFAILFALITLFVYLFVPLISNQIKVISKLDFEALISRAMMPLHSVDSFLLENKFISQENFFEVRAKEGLSSLIDERSITAFLSSLLNSLLSITGNIFIGLLAVLFITFFLLYEKGMYRKYFISLIPNRYFEVSISAINKIEKLLSNYLLGLLLQMLSIFSVAAFGLLISGVEYAVTIAVFAALANLIPFLGPILGATFGLLVAISTDTALSASQDYFFLIVKIASVFGIVQLTDNLFLQPIIFSKSVKAHPLEIFLIVFVGANIAGPIGMIAAIPSYTIVRVSLSEFYRGYRQYQVFDANFRR